MWCLGLCAHICAHIPRRNMLDVGSGHPIFWFVVLTKTQTLPSRWAQQKKLYFADNLNELAKKQSIMQTSLSDTAVYYRGVHLYY